MSIIQSVKSCLAYFLPCLKWRLSVLCVCVVVFCRKSARRWAVQRARSSMRTSLRWRRWGCSLHSDLVHSNRLTHWCPARGVCTLNEWGVTVQHWWPWPCEIHVVWRSQYESLDFYSRFQIFHDHDAEENFRESLCFHTERTFWNILRKNRNFYLVEIYKTSIFKQLKELHWISQCEKVHPSHSEKRMVDSVPVWLFCADDSHRFASWTRFTHF